MVLTTVLLGSDASVRLVEGIINLMSAERCDLSQLQRSMEIAHALSAQDAEDVVSEAMLIVLLKWGTERLADAHLVRSVAHNVALNLVRRRARRREVPLDSEDDARLEGSPIPIDPASAEALLRTYCRAAGIESTEDIRLLKLALLDGWSYIALSEILGASEEALRQRVSRLRARLREVLEAG